MYIDLPKEDMNHLKLKWLHWAWLNVIKQENILSSFLSMKYKIGAPEYTEEMGLLKCCYCINNTYIIGYRALLPSVSH